MLGVQLQKSFVNLSATSTTRVLLHTDGDVHAYFCTDCTTHLLDRPAKSNDSAKPPPFENRAPQAQTQDSIASKQTLLQRLQVRIGEKAPSDANTLGLFADRAAPELEALGVASEIALAHGAAMTPAGPCPPSKPSKYTRAPQWPHD